MKLVLIGAPAAGKGTQARKLIDYYKLAYISTGDILREHINNKTELGLAVQSVISSGKLVSDDMIIKIVGERINRDDCKNGFILDGFPRTKVQAEELDKLVGLVDKAVYITAPEDVILERITGRETCNKCGATYHKVSNPSKKIGVCDVCQNKLVQRKDDTYETGVARLKTFQKSADFLIDYYNGKGLLFEVDGLLGIDNVFKAIVSELGEEA